MFSSFQWQNYCQKRWLSPRRNRESSRGITFSGLHGRRFSGKTAKMLIIEFICNNHVFKTKFYFLQAFHGFRSIDVKTPIRVLSLFDGLSIGRHCLDKLNIVVQCYFSSEVDEKALKLQRYNFGDRVIPLGCVKSITKDVLRSLGKIDLLLAAPPCQDFSLANPRRLNFEGEFAF